MHNVFATREALVKKLLLLSVLLLLAVPCFAVNRTVLVVDDVIRMAKASVGDDQIIEFVRNSSTPFEITGDDVIAMNEAHVSPAVMKFVIDESAARMKAERGAAQQQQYDNRAQAGGDNDPQHVVVQHQYPVYAGPTYPSAYPYYYDPYYSYPYYPYYSGYPYVSIGFGLGYYGYYGYPYYGYGHYYGGGHYHGGGGGYHGGHGGGGHGGGGHGGGGHGGSHPGHGGGGHGGGGHH